MEDKKVLVVDDEYVTLKIISDILTNEGYGVKTAPNVDKALELIKGESFHLILSDIRMPGKSGMDLLDRIRAFNPDIPVVLMTAFASIETAMKAVRYGAFDYLIKPIDYDKLKSLVKHAIDRYELLLQNRRLLEELQELNASLETKIKERNRDLENILNSTHESIMTMDEDLVIKSANPKTVEIFGENCRGRKISEFIEGIDFDSVIPKMLNDPSYRTRHEFRYAGKFLEITLSPLTDFETDNIFGMIAVTEDVTKRKQLEVQLIQSAKMSAVGQLALGIAHEFNNILTGIIGYTSFAMSKTDIELIKKNLKVVGEISDRAVEIVKKLLSFSRHREEGFQLALIDQVVEDTLILIEKSFQSEGIRVVRHYGKIPPVKMNVGEIRQVVLNIVINSKHAMPKGGVIAISTELEEDYVRVDFSDTGIGIPKENLPRIFEPFFTTKGSLGSGTVPGTGLGLSVSYAIVERHGGRIDVSSEVGKGTTFTVRIPNIQHLSRTSVNGLPHEENKSGVIRSKKRGNILVVDDEEFICDLFKESLSEVDHNVVTASSGEDAIVLVRKNHFDIVFLDLTMPGKSGLDVLKEIRTLDPTSFVVIITGRIEENVSSQLIDAGAFSFIHKPFTLDQIQRIVSRILEGK